MFNRKVNLIVNNLKITLNIIMRLNMCNIYIVQIITAPMEKEYKKLDKLINKNNN